MKTRTRGTMWVVVVAVALLILAAVAWVVMPHRSERWEAANPAAEDAGLVARVLVVEGSKGFRIGRRGLTMTYTMRSPELKVKTPLGEAVCKLLVEENRAYVMEDDTVMWSDVWMTLKEPMGPNQWETNLTATVVTADAELVSVLQVYWAYTGGAHGNGGPAGRNFVWMNGEAHEIKTLDELFTPGSPWLAVLAKDVEVGLRKPGASFIDSALPFDSGEKLGEFTISRNGLEVHFAPYEVGSYAEGMYHVAVPWGKLRPYMKADSVVTKWVDEQAEASRAVPAG